MDLLELVALVAGRRSLGSGQVIKKADEQKVQQGWRRRLRFARGAQHSGPATKEQDEVTTTIHFYCSEIIRPERSTSAAAVPP